MARMGTRMDALMKGTLAVGATRYLEMRPDAGTARRLAANPVPDLQPVPGFQTSPGNVI